MSELHENELAYFVDSLTSHQRVVLQRLVGEFLTALPEHDQETHPELVPLLRQNAVPLRRMLDLLRRFRNDDDDSDIRPFSLTVPEPGHACLALNRRILTWHGLWDAKSHDWVKDVRIGRLTVDLHKLTEVTSSTIAWLVTLAQHVPEQRLHLTGVSTVIRKSIRVLRLEAVLVMAE